MKNGLIRYDETNHYTILQPYEKSAGSGFSEHRAFFISITMNKLFHHVLLSIHN